MTDAPPPEPAEEAASVSNDAPDDRPWYARLGPGLLAGASDDDPSGIAVYAQAGSQFGFGMVWMIVATLPMMVAVQLAAAHIGRANRAGLVAGIREHYSERLAKTLLVLVAIVNVVNIGADLAAMGAATSLVVGGRSYGFALLYGALSLAMQMLMPYERYARWLKWLTLGLVAYVVELAFVQVHWADVVRAIAWPQVAFTHAYATTAVAVLGTTISPYLLVWQAALEGEETRAERRRGAPQESPRMLRRHERRMRFDTWIGMLVSNGVAFCILIVAAAVFFAHGKHDVETTAQAAQALQPMAGHAASIVFALGVVGCGLLAIPAFAGSAAYGCAEAWQFRKGLNHPVARAPMFYAVLALCVVLGVAICFSPVDPFEALYWSAVLNGVAAVPMLVMLMLLASRRDVAGALRNGPVMNVLGWITVGLMTAAVAVMVVDLFTS